jgi:hypothetical protein
MSRIALSELPIALKREQGLEEIGLGRNDPKAASQSRWGSKAC